MILFDKKIIFFFTYPGELHDLQKRFRRVEDELQKKRAELREALRQDTIPLRRATPHSPSESVGSRAGSTHHGYTTDHHLSSEQGRGNYNGSARSQNDSNYRRYNHNPPPALTRSGVTLELLSPGRNEDTIERDDPYHSRRDEAETERTIESPTRSDIYLPSTGGAREYQNTHRTSSSHLSRSHERNHIRTNSENERNHRSGSGSNHRSRSGSRESKSFVKLISSICMLCKLKKTQTIQIIMQHNSVQIGDNMRRTKGRASNLQKRDSHILRTTDVPVSHKVGLPKVDLKSPTRVLEEKETTEYDNQSHGEVRNSRENSREGLLSNEELPYEEQSWEEGPPPLDRIKKAPKDNNIHEGSRSPSPSQDIRPGNGTVAMPNSLIVQRRTSCGTPVSEKSKVTRMLIFSLL